jgi:hypothetical protein
MKVGIFLQTTSGEAKRNIMLKFAEGVNRAGDEAVISDKRRYQKCDIALIFGFYNPHNLGAMQAFRKEVHEQHSRRGRHCVFIDADLLRFAGKVRADTANHPAQHIRISHGSVFPSRAHYFNEKSPSDRWELLCERKQIELKPYREDGEHILICLNSSSTHGRGWSAKGVDNIQWVRRTIKEIREHTDRPIRVRFHPNAKKDLQRNRPLSMLSNFGNITFTGGVIGDSDLILPPRTLIEDCEGAWASVVHTTSACVIPLIEGIPLYTNQKDCIAYSLANRHLRKIEEPKFYEREQWLYDLAYSCWNVDELASGMVWRRFQNRMNARGDYSKSKAKKLGLI